MSEPTDLSPRPGQSNQAVLVLALLAIVEFLVFLIGIVMGASGWDVAILILALAIAFVGSVPIVYESARPSDQRKLLIPLIAMVYMVFLVVPVFTQYFLLKGEFIPGTFRLNRYLGADIVNAQIVALLGLIALMVGFYTPFGRVAVSAIPRPTREWSPTAGLTVAFITLSLGWLVYVAGQIGLVPARAGSGALGSIATGSFFGISLLTLTWLRHRRSEAFLLLAIVLPLSMLFNFFTGSKRLFLTPPFMVALAFIVFERRVRKNWVIAGFVALVLLYPVSQFYRDAIQTDKSRSVKSFFADPGDALNQLSAFMGSANLGKYLSDGLAATGARLDALAVLTVIVKDTPDRVPYQNGRTIGLIFLSYVPRVLWPEKPSTTIGEWVSQSYGSPYDLHTDVGPTWMGELFFNWGYTGVLVGMFGLGLFCRVLQEMLFGANTPLPALFAACVVLYAVVRSPQGGLIGPINGIVYNLPPIIAAHVLVGLFGGYWHTKAPDSVTPRDPAGYPVAPRGHA